MKYQFILYEKNILRITSNQPPIPCFKPHKTWRLPTNHVNHRLLLHVALVFPTFAWLWMFLTEFALICKSLFRYCGARGKFLTLKNIVCFTHKWTVYASGKPHKPVIRAETLLVIFENLIENYLGQTWEYLEQKWIFFEQIWRFRRATLIRVWGILYNNMNNIYKWGVGMHFIYSVVKEFRGCFKGKFWRSIVRLFHFKAICLPVLKSLVHVYEKCQMNR